MKHVVGLFVAVSLVAPLALAEPSHPGRTIPKGAYTIEPFLGGPEGDGTRGIDPTPIYNNSGGWGAGYHINNAGVFVGDDVHMWGTTITSIRWVYTDGGSGGASAHSSSIAFFHNSANDAGPVMGNTVTFVSGTQTYAAVFNVTGLPQASARNPNGGWIITVGLPALVTGLDAWVGINSNSTTPTGGPAPGFRAGLRGGFGEIVAGYSHNLHWSGFFTGPTATSFFSTPGETGNFRWQLGGMPEPAAAALMAAGGLLVLRRRRA